MRAASSATARLLLLASLALLVMWPDAAAAENGLDQVRQMAARHGIASDPPVAALDRGTPSRPPGTSAAAKMAASTGWPRRGSWNSARSRQDLGA